MIITNCIHQHHTGKQDSLPASQNKYEGLSSFLCKSLPSREDTERICTACRHPSVLVHEILTTPYATLHQKGLSTPEILLEIPKPHMHPVLISRYMLVLASFLQHLHPDVHKEIKGLSESPRAIMGRLADLAQSLVTTNDGLLGSIEGLECVMIESAYQVNIGNLRRSWVSVWRAMSIAQLMGLDRPNTQAQYKVLDPKTKYNPQHMWFHILATDRYLCLLLGLSQGCLDRSIATDALLANETPMGRLERIHCVIASRILERNESDPSSHDIALTRTLDVELQKAARDLPSKWWLIPNLNTVSAESQALFWSTRRLSAQVLHYNLLNQLHLPYMLRSSSAGRKYDYSRITCVNASREVLSRFIALRNFNWIAYSCRTIDFLALMAAMTLLLAHLDSHHSEEKNLLAHQYHSDRAMIEQAQENMKELNRLNADALSAQSADLLRRLLAVEVGTPDHNTHCAGQVSVQEAGTETAPLDRDNDAVVSVHIPYFGIIKIARKGMSKEIPKPFATSTRTNYPAQSQLGDRCNTSSTESLHTESQMRHSGAFRSAGIFNSEPLTPVDVDNSHVEASCSFMSDAYLKAPLPTTSANGAGTQVASQLQAGFSDPLFQYEEYPELAAGAEDWALQGVDMAFFENLLRSAGIDCNESTG